MKQLLTYDPATGKVLARVQLSNDADLALYPNKLVVGVNLTPTEFANQPELYGRVVGGAFTLKAQVALAADKSQILANGIDEATVTVTGLVAATTIRVAGQTLNVLPVDPQIVITSDVPIVLDLQIMDDLQWSNRLTVRAAG